MSAIPLLRCLGQSHLEWHGQTIVLPTRKTVALLIYLVLHPTAHRREQLASHFWGNFGEAAARRSLRTALSALRKSLGDYCLLTDRETVQFNSDYALWMDARILRTQARQLLAQPTPDPNLIDLSLYQGDLLPGLDDEWIVRTREELRLLYLQVLLRLGQHWRVQGAYEQVIEIAERILQLESAEEAAHQLLIFAYMALGNRQAAQQQYAACVRALRDELDVEPSLDTVNLYRRSQRTPARTPLSAVVQSNLPLPLSSFIGRDHELERLKELLFDNYEAGERQRARLVTVTGPGGCGKTRLAIQVARTLVDHYRDGIWWVDLARLSEATQVPQAVATVLRVEQGPHPSLTAALVNALHSHHCLLVLDNCEHLVMGCATLLESLLHACPNLQILATSREALQIEGEISWLVPSLTLPDPHSSNAPQDLLLFDGIRLFVERAHATQHSFAFTPTTALAVRQICQQLDGIPLAIELAAVQVKVLTVEQIAARIMGTIGARFELLTGGRRTVLPRQQTLRATIEWSYVLLTEPEQHLFHHLAIFASSWSLAAAEMVSPSRGQMPVIALLGRLVDKSLVLAEPHGNVMRYRMLETIRQYALEQLPNNGDEAAARHRHLVYFLQQAEEAAHHFRSADQAIWLERVASEHDNFRSALAWALTTRQTEYGARLGIALWRFWYIRGYYDEGWQWLTQLLPQVDQPQLRASLLYGQGMIARRRADSAIAITCFVECLSLFRVLDDQRGVASALRGLGFIRYFSGDDEEARLLLGEALALFQDLDDLEGIAVTLVNLAYITHDPLEQERLYQESLVLRRRTGNLHGIATSLMGLAVMAIEQRNYATARTYLQEHLQINQILGNQDGLATAHAYLGNIAMTEEDYPAAQSLYEKSRQLAEATGDPSQLAGSILGLGRIALKRKEYTEARGLMAQALTMAQAAGARPVIATILVYVAKLTMAQGETQRAWTLTSAATVLWAPLLLNASLEQAELELIQAAASRLLNKEAAASAWAAGQAMTLAQVVTYALTP